MASNVNRESVTSIKTEVEPETGVLSQALFDFDGQREDMLPFKQGDIVTIIEMSENGWWKGTNISGRVGIFPYSYVRVKDFTETSFPIVRTLYALTAVDPEMLSFNEGELITVIREINQDWSYGKTKSGSTGRFPIKYVEFTGEQDEQTFIEETERWEKLEEDRKIQVKRMRKEKEELERKLREEEAYRQQQEELENLRRIQQEAEQLKQANILQQEELQRQREELERLRQKEQQTLRREVNEARMRAEMAERELEQARAEAALLRKVQEKKDARQSVMVRDKLLIEEQMLEMKVNKVSSTFKDQAPGPPPKKQNDDVAYVETEEDLFGEQLVSKKDRNKNKAVMKPVYVNVNMTVNDKADVKLAENKTQPEPEKLPVAVEPKPNEPPTGIPLSVTAVDLEGSSLVTSKKPGKSKVLSKFANLGKGQSCKYCDKPVGIANRVKACGGLYHDSCFRCSTCDKIIRNGEYVDRNENPYCLVCHKRGFGPKGFGFGGGGVLAFEDKKIAEEGSKGDVVKGEKREQKVEVSTESWVQL